MRRPTQCSSTMTVSSSRAAPPTTSPRSPRSLDRVEAASTWKTYLMCAFAAFGGICFGYQTAIMSGLLGTPYFIELHTKVRYNYTTQEPVDLAETEFGLSASSKAVMTSILACGVLVGALVAGDTADRFGRRLNIVFGCVVLCAGNSFQMAAEHLEVLFVFGRLVAGIGIGFVSAVIVMYISEIAPRTSRGAFVAAYQFCISLGILLANCIVYTTEGRGDSGAYRIPIGLQFVWAGVLATGLYCLPESPRYLVKLKQTDKAREALSRVRGQPADCGSIRDEVAELECCRDHEDILRGETTYWGTWLACFKGSIREPNSNLRRTLLGTTIQMMQQLTGINFIFYFGTTFFQQLGWIKDPFLVSLIVTLVNVCSTPVSFFTIEYFGRRRLLIHGAAGMIVVQVVIACIGVSQEATTKTRPPPHEPSSPGVIKAMVALICINIFLFAVTWGPTAWVVVGESFPLPLRARGVGLSTASNWFWNCVMATVTPFLVGNDPGEADLGPKIFFILASTCCLSLAFAYFLVPEMNGLTLEQIDVMLREVPPRKSSGWTPRRECLGGAGGICLHQMEVRRAGETGEAGEAVEAVEMGKMGPKSPKGRV